MERQAGLGRSLEDVLDSMTPVTAEQSSAGRALFEAEDLEQQLDQLMGDIRDLRVRVQHLVGMIPDDSAVDQRTTAKAKKSKSRDKSKKKSGKKVKHENKRKNEEHAGSRNGSAPRKTR